MHENSYNAFRTCSLTIVGEVSFVFPCFVAHCSKKAQNNIILSCKFRFINYSTLLTSRSTLTTELLKSDIIICSFSYPAAKLIETDTKKHILQLKMKSLGN